MGANSLPCSPGFHNFLCLLSSPVNDSLTSYQRFLGIMRGECCVGEGLILPCPANIQIPLKSWKNNMISGVFGFFSFFFLHLSFCASIPKSFLRRAFFRGESLNRSSTNPGQGAASLFLMSNPQDPSKIFNPTTKQVLVFFQ